MAKRKEGSFSTPISSKRPRQEFIEDSDDDFNEEEWSNLQNDSNVNSQVTSGDVGIIESIKLKNFMCHSMLGPFEFGSNVNFIVGNNGSGKSAVLTALIVGLGGKAIVTNRGSSVKGFVKDGQSSADITVVLRNRGEDAYRPEDYGNSITVKQHISSEGHRTYKLQSSTGATISSKKEELTAILDHFNIQAQLEKMWGINKVVCLATAADQRSQVRAGEQCTPANFPGMVDNPVSILTQEMSKQFLQSKNEGDKYKFFMKATQLEQMEEDYKYIIATKSRTSDQIEQGKEFLEGLAMQVSEKEARYKSIAALSEMQNDLKQLQNQIAWAMVRDAEKDVKTIKDDMESKEARTKKFVEKVNEWKDKVSKAEENHRTIQEKLEKLTEDAQNLEPSCRVSKVDVQTKRKAYNDAEVVHNRAQADLKRLGKDHEHLCQKIEELKNSAERISEPERLEKQKRIDHLKEQLRIYCDQDKSTNQELERFRHTIYTYKEDSVRLKKEECELRQKRDSQAQQLKELKESKTNRLKRFGEHLPALCEAIKIAHQQKQFAYKPVGPLGAFLHLKDAELALAVESCLKSLVHAFCCDNHRDERMLQSLMSKYCRPHFRPQIIVSRFQNKVYDVKARAVFHPNFPSVLTALEIDDPVVANCLIDMRGIEAILLIKNNSEARRVMQQNKPPQNCKEAFTGAGDQVYQRRYYSSEYARPRFLSQDVEADIRHLEEEVKNKHIRLSKLQQELHHVENEIRKNNSLLINHQQHQKDIQTKIRKIKLEIADLESVEEHQSGVIPALEEEVKITQQNMEDVKLRIHTYKKTMEQLKHIQQEAEQKLEEIKRKIIQIQEEAVPVQEGLNEAVCELERSKNNLRHYEEKEKEHLKSINALKNNLAAKEKELAEMVKKASQIHPERIEVTRTFKSLHTEIESLREKIRSERERTGDKEEIIRQFQEAKEKYQITESQVRSLKKFIKVLEEVMAQRFDSYVRFRRFLAMRCKIYFNTLLTHRHFSGKMQFDHKNGKLSITVQPGETNKAILDDMKSLSGGERSFSTVCFILSIWSITESPFRCLDEFDVFMDMVNRRISMDMMLRMAKSQCYRQFVLITPQNMSTLPSSRLVRILRMSDPERGQTTLNFHHRGDEDEGQE